MILQPREYFTIVRQIPDPNDSNTYYVRAEIRNARTDALIDTVNLVDQGNRRFSVPWQVPADSSGHGFYISIMTAIYTDAGYSVPSDGYAQELQTFLVDNRFRNLGGGGGGDDVDYKKIRKIMHEEITEFSPETDLSPVLAGIRGLSWIRDTLLPAFRSIEPKITQIHEDVSEVRDVANRIDAKEFPKTDLSPVLEAIKAIPEAPELDLGPVMALLKEIQTNFGIGEESLQKLIKEIPEIRDAYQKVQNEVKNFVKALGEKNVSEFFAQVNTADKEPKKDPEPVKPDYQAMARELVTKKKK